MYRWQVLFWEKKMLSTETCSRELVKVYSTWDRQLTSLVRLEKHIPGITILYPLASIKCSKKIMYKKWINKKSMHNSQLFEKISRVWRRHFLFKCRSTDINRHNFKCFFMQPTRAITTVLFVSCPSQPPLFLYIHILLLDILVFSKDTAFYNNVYQHSSKYCA